MALRPGDFHPTSAFAAPRGFVVWSTPSPWSRDFRCPPSALYTFPLARAWLGVGSDNGPGRSPSLTGFTSRISSRGLNTSLSPLCLPISPLGLERDVTRSPLDVPPAISRRHRMTVRTKQAQIRQLVVVAVAVTMIKLERNARAAPRR